MTAAIDFSTLTLNSEEARSVADLVFENVFAKPELEAVHAVMTGVEMDKYIPILGNYGLVGKVDPLNCGTNTAGQIATSQKQWTPKLISFRIAHCQSELPALLKFWKKSMVAAKTWEEVDNEMMAFITERATSATLDAILRIADFGDTAADVVAKGGNLTAGTDKTYFNMLDGMWKQVFTDQAGAALIHRYTIDENAEATKVAQYTLASDRALVMFRDMYDNIDPRAFEGGQLVFQVTRSLMANWQAYLEDKSLAFTLSQAEKGSTQYSYRGIPIVVRQDWDRIIKAYHDLGNTYYLPNRAILSDLNNIPVGTSDSESLTTIDSHYDKTDKKHYLDVAFKIDMKILLEYATAVAY